MFLDAVMVPREKDEGPLYCGLGHGQRMNSRALQGLGDVRITMDIYVSTEYGLRTMRIHVKMLPLKVTWMIGRVFLHLIFETVSSLRNLVRL